MKKVFAVIAALALLLCCTACSPQATYEATFTYLGTPLDIAYFSGGIERCAWDVEFYNGALYVGSGDYDRNLGPIYMVHYDFDAADWEVDSIVKDEQIARFYNFDDVLYTPGIDPKTSWELGNYYTCRGDEWETHNTLPGGVHNFDLIRFDGKLFAGLGVQEGDSPIVVSADEENWKGIPLIKDGKPRETHGGTYIRVYDFFTLNGKLYAYFYLNSDVERAREIYCYDGQNFVYHSDLIDNITLAGHSYLYISQKAEFKGKQYIASGNLYATDDMIDATQIKWKENLEVNDLRVIGNALYLLCDEKITHEDGSEEFRISVHKTKNGKDFQELFYFHYPVRALSFTHNDDTFYFGMGYGTTARVTGKSYLEENGAVLAVTYP